MGGVSPVAKILALGMAAWLTGDWAFNTSDDMAAYRISGDMGRFAGNGLDSIVL